MSEAKHTSGPWEVLGPIWKKPDDEAFYVVYAEDVQIVRLKLGANAHLMAAAPELLEAAKKVSQEFGEDDYTVRRQDDALLCLRRAIAKAEGHQ